MSAPEDRPQRRSVESKGRETTLADIARHAGVSAMTVSRALNRPESLKPKTLAQVMKAVEALGYVPNTLARSLATQRTHAVAVIIPVLNQVFAPTIEGMTRVLAGEGFDLILGISNYCAATEEGLVAAFLARRVDGVVLVGASHTPRTRTLLTQTGAPVVQMWTVPEAPLESYVGVSHEKGARAMTRYLCQTGRRRIGYIGGITRENDRTSARLEGFLAQMREFGTEVPEAHVEEAPHFLIEEGARAFERLWARAPDLEAVFAASDVLAAGAVFAAQRMGLRIPEDLAIAGFDDAEIARSMIPSLTTIRIDADTIGARAASAILERLATPDLSPLALELPAELIVREST